VSSTTTTPAASGPGATAPGPSRGTSLTGGTLLTYLLVMAFDGLALWGILRMIEIESWLPLAITVVGTIAVNVVYISRRRIPGKYLLPTVIVLTVFAVIPVIYNVYVSFTNYGTGNLISKEQALSTLEAQTLPASDTAARYRVDAVRDGEGFLLLFTDESTGEVFASGGEGLEPADADALESDGNRITAYQGEPTLNLAEKQDNQAALLAIVVPTDDGFLQLQGFNQATEVVSRYQYDSGSDTLTDLQTGTVYRPVEGTFTAEDGSTVQPGWITPIGLDNYVDLFTEPRIRDPFVRAFIWTFVLAGASVLLTFALGLLLALVFQSERMRLKGTYRVLLIIPYALPTFMTILVWRGMMNESFGILNEILPWQIPWLNDPDWARFSLILVNLWLGYSYMFLVSTGALTSIPTDLKEAAFVDGATGLTAFRKVTLPLLLVAMAPVLISSFAFNFNNYNLVTLLTDGGPPIPGSIAGETDILITYTYSVAFEGAGQNYGLATAISTIIFFLVAGISAISFRFTRTFEEIN
jgi:arabinogalactan oligomer / maltooligosaccharide transport system permease protein